MPTTGIALKAGWYEKKKTTIHITSASKSIDLDNTKSELNNSLSLDLSKYLPNDFNGTVSISAKIGLRHSNCSLSSPKNVFLRFYTKDMISDNNFIYGTSFKLTSMTFTHFTYSFTADITDNIIYCASYCDSCLGVNYYSISDYYYELSYPDTTKLIL